MTRRERHFRNLCWENEHLSRRHRLDLTPAELSRIDRLLRAIDAVRPIVRAAMIAPNRYERLARLDEELKSITLIEDRCILAKRSLQRLRNGNRRCLPHVDCCGACYRFPEYWRGGREAVAILNGESPLQPA